MTQVSSMWQEIVTAALLGSQRQPLTLHNSSDPLGELLSHLSVLGEEQKLLGAAAVVSLYRRAGMLPASDAQITTEPCRTEESARCSQRAASHLALMLKGQYKEAMPEYLKATAAARKRVSEEFLPALLEFGRGVRADLREIILPVLGRRGAWLAAQNADWAYAIESENESVWETGSLVARIAFLGKLRKREPAKAREMLASTWNAEAPKDRAAFLEILSSGLSATDEPFLETVLADRRREVRRQAAELLARLPESLLSRRMIERLRPLVSLKRSLIGRSSIEVNLPAACDESMLRDGIQPKPPTNEMGEKAWWLCEMISILDPSFWCEEFNKPPAEIIQVALKSEWSEALLAGWVNAAKLHSDWKWVKALAEWWLYQKRQNIHQANRTNPFAVIHDMPAELLEKLALEAFSADKEPVYDLHTAYQILQLDQHEWSTRLTRSMIESLRRRIKKGDGPDRYSNGVRVSLKRFAFRIPATMFGELSKGWPVDTTVWEYWSSAVDEFLAIIGFRHEMIEAINEGD